VTGHPSPKLSARPTKNRLRARNPGSKSAKSRHIVGEIHSLFVAPFHHEFQVSMVITVVEKYRLPPVPALRQVVRHAGNDEP